jgi:hypothetical protein
MRELSVMHLTVHSNNSILIDMLPIWAWASIGWIGFIIFCYTYNEKLSMVNRYHFGCLFFIGLLGGPFTFFASLVTDFVESRKKNVRR